MFSLNKKTIILAHRGARGLTSTENSFEAFYKTVEVGGNWVELDVRKTKDNKFIVFHDEKLNGISINKLNVEEIIRIKSEVVELKDVLIRYKGKLKYDIELKEEGDEKEIVKLIREYLDYKEFFISSFSEASLLKIKKIDHNIKTGLLMGKKGKIKNIMKSLFLENALKKTKADLIIPHYSLMNFFFFKRMERFKKPIIVWTVNDPKMIRKFKTLKVSGIITDRPDLGLKE